MDPDNDYWDQMTGDSEGNGSEQGDEQNVLAGMFSDGGDSLPTQQPTIPVNVPHSWSDAMAFSQQQNLPGGYYPLLPSAPALSSLHAQTMNPLGPLTPPSSYGFPLAMPVAQDDQRSAHRPDSNNAFPPSSNETTLGVPPPTMPSFARDVDLVGDSPVQTAHVIATSQTQDGGSDLPACVDGPSVQVESESFQAESSIPPRSIRSPVALDPKEPRSPGLIGPLSPGPASLRARDLLVYGTKYSPGEQIGYRHDGPERARNAAPTNDQAAYSSDAMFEDAPRKLKTESKKRKHDPKEHGKSPQSNKKASLRKSGRLKLPDGPVKEATSPKDVDSASTLLKDKIELTAVLDDHDCRELGEIFWIFTIEQLRYYLTEDKIEERRQDIEAFRRALASSPLITSPGKDNSLLVDTTMEGDKTGGPPAPPTHTGDPLLSAQPSATAESDSGKVLSSRNEATDDDTAHLENGGGQENGGRQGPDVPASEELTLSKSLEINGQNEINEDQYNWTRDAVPTEENLQKADALLEKWKKQLNDWSDESESIYFQTDMNTRFCLDGPIGRFVPESIRNFLKSVSIDSLHEFFSVRKTESSPFVAALIIWRRYSDLTPELKPFNVSRYLTGLSTRLETALSSVPPPDEITRKWMRGALVVLSGASKDFVIDECRCFNPNAFVDSQTKSWSSRLVEWRKKKNKTELKGSGKVAMVSGWKTAVREALEVEKEKGPIVDEAKFIKAACEKPDYYGVDVDDAPDRAANAEHSVPSSPQYIDSGARPANIKSQQASPVVDTKLKAMNQPRKKGSRASIHDKDPIAALSSSARQFLESMGIFDAESFLSSRTSTLATELVNWRSEMNMAELKGGGESATVSGWKASVRKRANQIGLDDVAAIVPFDQPLARASSGRVQSVMNQMSNPSKSLEPASIPQGPDDNTSYPGVLFGRSRCRFNVQDHNTFSLVYHFELSVRNSALVPSRKALFVTYLGSSPDRRSSAVDPGRTGLRELHLVHSGGAQTFPVLRDVPLGDSSGIGKKADPYIFERPGCGLIEIGRYGATPFPPEDRMSNLIQQVRSFIIEHDHPSSGRTSNQSYKLTTDISNHDSQQQPDLAQAGTSSKMLQQHSGSPQGVKGLERHTSANAIAHACPLSGLVQYFLHISNPMEYGQVAEIAFHPPRQVHKKTLQHIVPSSSSLRERVELAQAILTLSGEDLSAFVRSATGISAEMSQAMLKDQNEESEGALTSKLRLTVSRRRLHWVGTILLSQLSRLEGQIRNIDTVSEEIHRLLIVPELSRHYISVPLSVDGASARSLLKEEVSQEIETNIALRSPCSSLFAFRCPDTSAILQKCTDLASDFVLTAADSTNAFQQLEKDLCDCVSSHTSALLKGLDKDLARFAAEPMILSDLRQAKNDKVESLWLSLHDLPTKETADVLALEAYKDAMALVGESEFVDEIDRNRLAAGDSIVKCRLPWRPSSSVTRNLRDATSCKLELHEGWYIKHQIVATAAAVAESVHSVAGTSRPDGFNCLLGAMLDAAKGSLTIAGGDESIASYLGARPGGTIDEEVCVSSFDISPFRTASARPSSLPLFLALVWPRLRASYRWRLHSGDTPDDVVFIPPIEKRKGNRHAKREQMRKKAKLEKRLMGIGLGNVSKRVKRMFIASAKQGSNSKTEVSAPEVIERFVEEVFEAVRVGPNEEGTERIQAIGNALKACFGELKALLDFTQDEEASDSSGQGKAETDGPAKLMRMLMLVPSLLRQSGLPVLQVDETVGVINDLAHFIAENHRDLFDPTDHLCKEVYEFEPGVDSFLKERLQDLSSTSETTTGTATSDGTAMGPAATDHIREVVLPDEVGDLTEFVSTVLRQTVACRANVDDVTKKERKHVVIGYPGLMCRHCAGRGKEGRYFFSNVGSLGTASGVLYDHLMRCNYLPESLKATLIALKRRHPDDLKQMRVGAQAEFFKGLWDRLFSENAHIDSSDLLVLAPDSQAKPIEDGKLDSVPQLVVGGQATTQKAPTELKSHIDLAKYLQTESPWKDKGDLQSCLELYYKVMEYGGQLYCSNSMPTHYSSEWLLDKLVPHRLTLKRTFKNVG